MAWWATPHAVLWWAIIIALVVILAMAAGQAARALREIKRLKARIDGLADLPVAQALPRVEESISRIERAVDQVEPLIERAKIAIAAIRRGPLPPRLVAGIRRVAGEIAAFREVARR